MAKNSKILTPAAPRQALGLTANAPLYAEVKDNGLLLTTSRAQLKTQTINPFNSDWQSFFITSPAASEDFLPARAAQTQAEREAF